MFIYTLCGSYFGLFGWHASLYQLSFVDTFRQVVSRSMDLQNNLNSCMLTTSSCLETNWWSLHLTRCQSLRHSVLSDTFCPWLRHSVFSFLWPVFIVVKHHVSTQPCDYRHSQLWFSLLLSKTVLILYCTVKLKSVHICTSFWWRLSSNKVLVMSISLEVTLNLMASCPLASVFIFLKSWVSTSWCWTIK